MLSVARPAHHTAMHEGTTRAAEPSIVYRGAAAPLLPSVAIAFRLDVGFQHEKHVVW
jgi:hypothetical protein